METNVVHVPEPYDISYDEFRVSPLAKFTRLISRPKTIPRYNLGETVSRANFVPMLIDSFAKSRGRQAVQYAYLQWLKQHTGFDWETTLRAYKEAGGWHCLTRAEQQRVEDSMKAVKIHKLMGDTERGKVFDGQVADMLGEPSSRNPGGLKLDDDHPLAVAVGLPTSNAFIQELQHYFAPKA